MSGRDVVTQFTRAGDVDIAYQVVGDGPLDVVFIPGWVSNLEVAWEFAELAAFYERLAGFARLIVFDKRGTGLSDRVTGMITIEERADDIRAVMDAVGSTRAAIIGWGDGAAMAATFAATHPERVVAIVLGSLSVTRPEEDGAPVTIDTTVMQGLADHIESGSWGQGDFAPIAAPSRAEDERYLNWWRRWERLSATPNAAATMLRWFAELDLRPVLPSIQVPTLVVQRADVGIVDLPSVRWAASQIPGAQYLELPGTDTLPFTGDSEAILTPIQEFLTGAPGPSDFDRMLATVLFTDIVGSTRQAEQLGDRRWRYLLDAHNQEVRRVLPRYDGHEIDTAGDGFLVTFDGPVRAIHCACAVRNALADLGLEIRTGLHTGEVEQRDDGIAGLAVHIAARVMALAHASEVLVTDTLKTLVLGSAVQFEDRGAHVLKGVPDEWHLYAVVA